MTMMGFSGIVRVGEEFSRFFRGFKINAREFLFPKFFYLHDHAAASVGELRCIFSMGLQGAGNRHAMALQDGGKRTLLFNDFTAEILLIFQLDHHGSTVLKVTFKMSRTSRPEKLYLNNSVIVSMLSCIP